MKSKKKTITDIDVDTYKEYYLLVNYTDEPDGTIHVIEGLKDNVLAIPNKAGTKGRRYFLEATKKNIKFHAIVYEKAHKGYVATFESRGKAYVDNKALFTTNGNNENYGLRIRGTTAYAPHNVVTKKEVKAQFPNLKLMRNGTSQQFPKEVFDWITARLLK